MKLERPLKETFCTGCEAMQPFKTQYLMDDLYRNRGDSEVSLVGLPWDSGGTPGWLLGLVPANSFSELRMTITGKSRINKPKNKELTYNDYFSIFIHNKYWPDSRWFLSFFVFISSHSRANLEDKWIRVAPLLKKSPYATVDYPWQICSLPL